VADRGSRLIWTGFAAVAGFAAAAALVWQRTEPPRRPVYYPLPHHVPKYPGGVSFRFAMVHDVLHERYPKHGPAHYQERNRLTREKLAGLPADDPAAFPLTDDLAAGLARLGKLDEAVELLRAKLARQQAKGLTGRDLYSTYANLGAILFHARLAEAAGSPAARKEAEEGVGFIKKAVEVNPQAHFGRERWQVAYAEFLLAATGDPAALTKTDFVGQPLAETVLSRAARAVRYSGYSVAARDALGGQTDFDPKAHLSIIRGYITHVSHADAPARTDTSSPSQVPFDEPCLGIVGMWRQGIGPDPHFALCLGEIMLRVGQRHIAWAAFERAGRMADRFGPTTDAHEFLRLHCRQRQQQIEATLTAAEAADLRPRFDAELAHGENYQKAYQQYEADKIAAGASIFDGHFFDAFHAGRGPIASPSGSEEWYATLGDSNALVMTRVRSRFDQFCWGLGGAGVAAGLAAWLVRPRSALAPAPPGG
jgi:hypothetical protein